MHLKRFAIAVTLLSAGLVLADEGMWTFNNFPSETFKKKYGWAPTQEWLDHVRLSSVRIAGGCSASIVSPQGLVMTNHHCAHECIEQKSTAKKDLVKGGFFAKADADEIKCPDLELNQLSEITDVTKTVQDATKGAADDKFNDVQRSAIAKIEKDCATSDDVRCEVVNLYRGGRFDLYKYQRYQDVRVVFAPELAIAFFGGDPDNFNFPRYDLDVSFLRIYGKDGKPAKTDNYFKWSTENAKDGDVTFVSGNPGGTSRLLTLAQLEYDRDVKWPTAIARLSEYRGFLNQYAKKGTEAERVAKKDIFYVENSLKAIKGRHQALADKAFFKSRVDAEKAFRTKVDADPKMKSYGAAWDGIAASMDKLRIYRKDYDLERAIQSDIFSYARTLLRNGDESTKPNGERLREYADARLPQLKQNLLADVPFDAEFETAKLAYFLTKLREELGADHPVIKRVYGQKSPEEIAAATVKGTKLKDAKNRKKLFEGGKKAVDDAKDPMIELARAFDPDARIARKKIEDEVDGVVKKNGELLAKAMFQVYGTSVYPDATFTLRLSYGKVDGWDEGGARVNPVTTFAGAFERNTGRDPFALPKSWLDAKPKLDLTTPFDLVTTNDIIGGNSGSPMVNKDGEVVGLVFDGNIHSLGGDYGFDEKVNRTVAVHSAALIEALGKVYGAKRLVDELKPTATPKAGQK